MVLINFFGRLGICVTIAIDVSTMKASLAIYQYYCHHFCPSIWAEELHCIDAVQTAHFTLFLYKARGLDNPSCLIQAYNTTVRLIDSWIAYLQYMPLPLPPKTSNIYDIFLQYHR
uniref:Uncharacterized protein n=1 Tax=Romanomermis culicivorax TaxID=13658 RepID=A0A915K058_ROMCU